MSKRTAVYSNGGTKTVRYLVNLPSTILRLARTGGGCLTVHLTKSNNTTEISMRG